MKVPVSWLRDFVDVTDTPEQVAETMSVRGFAVEGIEPLGTDDATLDFEVTANRPDCLSVVGMAREVATAYRLPLRRPAGRLSKETRENDSGGPGDLRLASLSTSGSADLDVAIEAPDLCPRYAGVLADVTLGPSPEWMQARLLAAGVRPISNVVDVTNYVLLELGHPLHAFDHARVTDGRIVVRRAQLGESLETLDGVSRPLAPDMLLIADAARAIAVAGVMGGANSEVSHETSTIVIESAYFNPQSVRSTSKALGLKTESSMRFERGADPRLPVTALERACALLDMTGAGRARGTLVDCYPTRIETATVALRRARVTRVLGLTVPDDAIRRILEALGFALHDTSEGWSVTVPTRRVDARREVDLIEEVARHFGYDQIPVTFPALAAAPPPMDPAINEARRVRTALAGAGFFEALTFGFISASAAAPFASADDVVPIANPLSETFAVLRPSLVPGLLDAAAHNRRRQQRDVRLFEVGNRFSRHGGERRSIAFAWTGAGLPAHWSTKTRGVDFFDASGIVAFLGQVLGASLTLEAGNHPALLPGRSASVCRGDEVVGFVGQAMPTVTDAHGLPHDDQLYVAEFDLGVGAASGVSTTHIDPLPRHPAVPRDISILVADTVAARAIRATVWDAAPATLVDVREFDRYQGQGVADGHVSLSLHLTFRATDRTLTDGEVQDAMAQIIDALGQAHGAVQR